MYLVKQHISMVRMARQTLLLDRYQVSYQHTGDSYVQEEENAPGGLSLLTFRYTRKKYDQRGSLNCGT